MVGVGVMAGLLLFIACVYVCIIGLKVKERSVEREGGVWRYE